MSILTLRPTSDVTAGMAPTPGGTHYTCVDEVIADDADYVSTDWVSSPDTDLYGIGDTAISDPAIVSVTIYARCTSTGGTLHFHVVTEGGTHDDDPSAGHDLTASWALYHVTYTTNPETGLAWTWTQVNALQAGLIFTATALQTSKCSQFYVEVAYIGEVDGISSLEIDGVNTVSVDGL
jgi:hypothetical protein